MTLEEVLQEFSRALEVERQANWVLGDIGSEAVKMFGKDVVGKFAELARCSKERIRQLIVVAFTFPAEYRYPDVPWSFYRKVYQTARRTGEDALKVLELAMSNGWSEKDLSLYKADGDIEKTRFRSECSVCGSKITIDSNLESGLSIYCPVCEARGKHNLLMIIEREEGKNASE